MQRDCNAGVPELQGKTNIQRKWFNLNASISSLHRLSARLSKHQDPVLQ